MRFYLKWHLLIIIVICITELSTIRTTTLNVKQRVALLKKQVKDEIRAKLNRDVSVDSSFEADEYENEHLPITPIIKIKKKNSEQPTTVKTPSISTTRANASSTSSQKKKKSKTKNKKKTSEKSSLRKPIEIFYRRLLDENSMNTPVQWTHCQDLITPYLNGMKKDLTHPKHLSPKHPIVTRFIQLLSENTTDYSRDDIYSILYQISNLNLRLFQWDVPSLNVLYSILVKDKRHTFSNLKHGIRTHFADWHLDISNVTNLLRQTRIFRPPCVRISDSTGSTKSNKHTIYPKKRKPTTTCQSDEDEFECKYRH